MTYPEQYDRYLGMVETTLERLLPQRLEALPIAPQRLRKLLHGA